MTKIFRTHALDLPEVRSIIASSLGLKVLTPCARVSRDWNDTFTPPLYNSVALSKHGPSIKSVERNKHFIQRLKIQSSAYEKLSLTSAEDKVVVSVMANSTLATLDLSYNSIGDNGAQALSKALKINSTLITLDLGDSAIGLKCLRHSRSTRL